MEPIVEVRYMICNQAKVKIEKILIIRVLARQLTIILGPCQNIRAMRPGPKHWVASDFVTVMSRSLSTARECKITEKHVKA